MKALAADSIMRIVATVAAALQFGCGTGVAVAAGRPTVPLEEAITRAPVFLYPLVWIGQGPPPPPDSAALWQAIETMRVEGVRSGLAALEGFVSERPHSPWTPGVRAALAEYYYDHARPTLALQHWEVAWDAAKKARDPNGK